MTDLNLRSGQNIANNTDHTKIETDLIKQDI